MRDADDINAGPDNEDTNEAFEEFVVPGFYALIISLGCLWELGVFCLWITAIVFRKKSYIGICSGDLIDNSTVTKNYPYM